MLAVPDINIVKVKWHDEVHADTFEAFSNTLFLNSLFFFGRYYLLNIRFLPSRYSLLNIYFLNYHKKHYRMDWCHKTTSLI